MSDGSSDCSCRSLRPTGLPAVIAMIASITATDPIASGGLAYHSQGDFLIGKIADLSRGNKTGFDRAELEEDAFRLSYYWLRRTLKSRFQ